MYQVVIEKRAQKQLAKIPPPQFQNKSAALKNLEVNPRPHGYKKLKRRTGFRVRIGDYWIIYNIEDTILTVFVFIIGNRKDVYD